MSDSQVVVESPRGHTDVGVFDPVVDPVDHVETGVPVETAAPVETGVPVVDAGTDTGRVVKTFTGIATPPTGVIPGVPPSGEATPPGRWGDSQIPKDTDSDDGVLSDRAPSDRAPSDRGSNSGVPRPRGRGGRGGERSRGGRGRGGRGDFDGARGPGGRGGGRGGGKTPGYYQSQSRGGIDAPTRFQGDHPRSTASLWKLSATINGESAVFIVAGNNPAEARGQLLESYKSRAFDYTKANLWSSSLKVEGPTGDGYGDTVYGGGIRELFEKGYICRVRTGAVIM